MDKFSDVVVIGGGVAGLSAALMLGRARRSVLVVDHGKPRNRFAAQMHAVLGHDGADPLQVLATGRQEIARYGAEIVEAAVDEVVEVDGGLLVRMGERGVRARSVVVATGVRDELPDLPGLAERWGKTVLHCPYCHGWEVRDRSFGVLATSALSLHQAQLVRQWSGRVTLFSAGAGPLQPELVERLESRGIDIVGSPVVEVLGEGEGIDGVRTADGTTIPVEVIFTGGTLRPQDDFLAPLALQRASGPAGDVLVTDEVGRTSHPWVRAVGNLTSPMGNVPAAMNSGTMAGAMLNMDLVNLDFDAAVAARRAA